MSALSWPTTCGVSPALSHHLADTSSLICLSSQTPNFQQVTQISSTHEMLNQCWFNAAPPSSTLAQNYTTIGSACQISRKVSTRLIRFSGDPREPFNQCCYNVGPVSQTVARQHSNISSMFHISWKNVTELDFYSR